MIHNRKAFKTWLGVAGFLVAAQTVHAQPSILNTNLIVNGNAEAGPASPDGKTVVSSIPDWTAAGKANVLPYGLTGYVLLSDPAPPDHQFQYFACRSGKCTFTQDIPVSSGASTISGGNVKYTASAYLGSITDVATSAQMIVAFKNASGQTISAPTVGPAGFNGVGMSMQQQIGLVPTGTMSITVTLSMNNLYGAADSLSLVLTTLGTTPMLDTNLVENPGAEVGPSAPSPGFALYVPDWSTDKGTSVAPYGGTRWITTSDPGPPNPGVNLFHGGSPGSSMYQGIDVSAAATLIDSGEATYEISAWLGCLSGYTSPTLTYIFYDWSGLQLAPTAHLGPNNDRTALSDVSGSGTLPSGTRRVNIVLSFPQRDSLADNISFTLSAPSGSPTGVLPQFAVGGSFVTDFYVVNRGKTSGNFSISFYADDGSPIAVPYGADQVTTLSDSVPAGGASYYEIGTPQGAAASGSAVISADPSITIQALFRRQGSDGSYYEAAVPVATGSSEVAVPFDGTTFSGNGSQIYTGLAIANLDASNAATVSCTARDSGGNAIPNAIPAQMLNPLGHWANYLFPALTGKRGTLDCTSNTKIGAVGIRALGTNALSSLPVITLPISGSGGTKVLPQFAVGASFVTDFYVVNSGTNAANFSISFHDDNGDPVALPFAGMSDLATLSGSIPAGGAGFYEAGTPDGAAASGSAVITSDPSITIQALFRRQGSDGSYYEAAVPATVGSNEILVPFDATKFSGNGDQIYTGFALANLNASNPANVACTARDSVGNSIFDAITAPALNPLGHWAQYLFPALTGLRGTLDCTSNTQIGAVGIRALGTNALSSLPVIGVSN